LVRWVLVTAVLAFCAEAFRLFDFLELRTYDIRVRHRATRRAPVADELVVVAIDAKSEDLLGPFPWPHQVYSAFRAQLDALGVRGAFFALYFNREEAVEATDANRSRLYLIRPYTTTEMRSLWKPPRVAGWQSLPSGLTSANTVTAFSTIVSSREDGTYRYIQARVLDEATDRPIESLEARFAADVLGVDVSSLRLPLDSEGRLLLPRGSVEAPTVSFVDVLNAERDSDLATLLRDSWLVVGASDVPMVGAVQTPFGHRTALELRAVAVNALLTGDTIQPRRLVVSASLLTLLATGFAVLGAFWRRREMSVRRVVSVGFAALFAYGIVAEGVFVLFGTWLAMVAPFAFVGATTLAWAFAVDAARLRTAQQRALQSEREAAFGVMAAQVRHEVRNLLNSIRAPAEMLRRNFQRNDPLNLRDRPDALVDEMNVIIERTDKLSELVENELSFLKPGSLEPTEQDAWIIVESALALVSDELAKAGIEVHRDVPATRSRSNVDADKLRVVFVNLLRNAVQAMPQGGILTLVYEERVIRARGRCVVLSVSDSGVGMDAEQLERMFEPFYTTKARGLGLGLVNVRNVVDAHHGEIRVRSAKDKGTTFEVLLPAAS
jgi:signal transduction histidine kinase